MIKVPMILALSKYDEVKNVTNPSMETHIQEPQDLEIDSEVTHKGKKEKAKQSDAE